MSLLDSAIVRRVRQNHAIEHGTITVLMRRNPGLQLVGGRSNHHGFFVYGVVEGEPLRLAAEEALTRLQGGEHELAIHPNCGTNLVAAGTLAGLAALGTSILGRRRRLGLMDQIPAAIMAATTALLVGRPVGTVLQRRVTTLAEVGNLRLGQIRRRQIGSWVQHFVHVEEVG